MRSAAGQVYRGSRVLVGEQIKPATVVVEGGKITAVHDGMVEVAGASLGVQFLNFDIDTAMNTQHLIYPCH